MVAFLYVVAGLQELRTYYLPNIINPQFPQLEGNDRMFDRKVCFG